MFTSSPLKLNLIHTAFNNYSRDSRWEKFFTTFRQYTKFFPLIVITRNVELNSVEWINQYSKSISLFSANERTKYIGHFCCFFSLASRIKLRLFRDRNCKKRRSETPGMEGCLLSFLTQKLHCLRNYLLLLVEFRNEQRIKESPPLPQKKKRTSAKIIKAASD